MRAAQVPEYLMSLLHSSMVHQVALSTFQQQPSSSANKTSNDTKSATTTTTTTNAPNNLSFDTVDKSAEFYHRLEGLGFSIGLRTAERLLASTPVASNNSAERPQDDAINLLRTVLWPSLFGKELGRENDPAGAPTSSQPPASPATTNTTNSNNNIKSGNAAAANDNNLVYKLIDVDFSWVRSVALSPEAPSLADPFIRGMSYDLLEDPSTFAAGISAMMTNNSNNSDKQQNQKSHHQNHNHNNQKQHHNHNH